MASSASPHRVDAARIFVLFDGLGLVAKWLERVANSDPPTVRTISDNPVYAPHERSAEEANIVGRIRWFA